MYEYEADLDFSSRHPIYCCWVVAENRKKARLNAIEVLKEMLKKDGINFNFEQDLSGLLQISRGSKQTTI